MTVSYVPAGYRTLTPYVMLRGADRFLSYIGRAFDAREVGRTTDAQGTIKNAEIQIGDSMLYLAEAPAGRPTMPASLYLYVPDCDATYRRAIEAGATSIMEPKDRYYGDRICGVTDPFGNFWWIATHIEDVSPDEIQRRSDAEDAKQ